MKFYSNYPNNFSVPVARIRLFNNITSFHITCTEVNESITEYLYLGPERAGSGTQLNLNFGTVPGTGSHY
jgi:hypothetical protein